MITGVYGALRRLWQADSLRGRLARGTVWSIAGALISQGLTLISSIIAARVLGNSGFGELGIINSTVGMFGTFAGFGLGLTTTKHVAEFRETAPIRAGRVIALTTTVAALSSGLLAAGLVIFAPVIALRSLSAPHLAGELRIGALLLIFNTVNGVQTGTLSGFEAFKEIAKSNLLKGLISFPFLVAGVLVWRLPGAVIGLVLASAIGCVTNRLMLVRQCKQFGVRVNYREMWAERKILSGFAIPAFISNAAMGPVTWLANTMLVNQHNGYAELGVFNAAFQWRTAMLFLPQMVGQVALPMLSSLNGKNSHASARRVVAGAIGVNALCVLPVIVPILFFSRRIMSLYGPGFSSEGWVLIITAFTAGLYAIETPVGDIIAATNKMWVGAYMNLGWACALLSSAWILLRHGWGAGGLATAYLIAYTVHGLWTFWVANSALAVKANEDKPGPGVTYEEGVFSGDALESTRL